MKRIIAGKLTVLIMAIALAAGTAGCGDKDKPQTEEPVVTEEETDNAVSDDTQSE